MGSEHKEITEGLDEVEAAEEKRRSKGRKHRGECEDDELSVDGDWDKDHLGEDVEDENTDDLVGMYAVLNSGMLMLLTPKTGVGLLFLFICPKLTTMCGLISFKTLV